MGTPRKTGYGVQPDGKRERKKKKDERRENREKKTENEWKNVKISRGAE